LEFGSSVEYLPSKFEAPSSNSGTAKKAGRDVRKVSIGKSLLSHNKEDDDA
jgi:hypothetical protein